jgi:hypothetical protein
MSVWHGINPPTRLSSKAGVCALVAVLLALGCAKSALEMEESPADATLPLTELASSPEGDYVTIRGEQNKSPEKWAAREAELVALDGKLVEVDGIMQSGPSEVKNPSAGLCGVSLDLDTFAPWNGCRVVIRGKIKVIDWDALHAEAEEEFAGPGGTEVSFEELYRIVIYPLQRNLE